MTQKQFDAKFTKRAFFKFLQSLKGRSLKTISAGSGDSCFFARFAKKVFKTNEVVVGWKEIHVNNVTLKYPAWAACYLSHLENIMDVHSPEFAALACKASITWLAD